MIERALQKGLKPSWVTADEVYGQSYEFRKFLEDHHQSYVLAVPKTQSICRGLNKFPAQDILPSVKKESWQKLSCGQGSKGLRFYGWALLPINSPDPSYQRWLLLRKNLNLLFSCLCP
jgi:SRSO17 transposase